MKRCRQVRDPLLVAALLVWALALVPGKAAGQAKEQTLPAKLVKVTGTLLEEKNNQPVKQQPLLLFVVLIGPEAGLPQGQAVVMRLDVATPATTDGAGRFTFEGVAPAKYTIGYGKEYNEETIVQGNTLTVRGRMMVFEVKDTDLKLGTVVGTVKNPPKGKAPKK